MFDDSDDSGDDSLGEEVPVRVAVKEPKRVLGAKHLQEMREVLDLDKFQRKKEARIRKRKARKAKKKLETGGGLIQTLASSKLGQPAAEVVHYTDYRRLKKPKLTRDADESRQLRELVQRMEGGKEVKEVTLQQARYVVYVAMLCRAKQIVEASPYS